MFDFKYHIVSIVAVFLALGIGVVMGSMTAEQGVITEQEKQLITTMEKDYDDLRTANSEMREEATKQEEFSKSASDILLSGRLVGKSVAVVVTGVIDNPTIKELEAALRTAGATQSSVTRFSGTLNLSDKDAAASIGAIVGYEGQNTGALRAKALEETALWIAAGSNAKAISDLADQGFLAMSGVYNLPVDCVIMIGGAGPGKTLKPSELDEHLIKTFLGLSVQIAGAETGDAKTSYMTDYQRLGLATVDNIGEPAGFISIVYALSGQPGNYGIKTTADNLMPAPSGS